LRDIKKLSAIEQKAIDVLKSCGWQIVTGPHLEDWDEGLTIKAGGYDDAKDARVDIAIVKVDM